MPTYSTVLPTYTWNVAQYTAITTDINTPKYFTIRFLMKTPNTYSCFISPFLKTKKHNSDTTVKVKTNRSFIISSSPSSPHSKESHNITTMIHLHLPKTRTYAVMPEKVFFFDKTIRSCKCIKLTISKVSSSVLKV